MTTVHVMGNLNCEPDCMEDIEEIPKTMLSVSVTFLDMVRI